MTRHIHVLTGAAAMAALGVLTACGGGSGTTPPPPPPPAHAVTITAGPGPSLTRPALNGAFVTVTVCVPNSSQCVTVPNVLLDTGSSGLRVLSSALGSLPLTNVTSPTDPNTTIAGCVQFVDLSYNWGPIALADLKMAGEVASSVPIQIIASPTMAFPAAPSTCSNGGTAGNSVDSLSANGIIGLSTYIYDCGSACAPGTSSNGGMYYACANGTCQVTTLALANQLQNPVARFATDNNGISITLPSLPDNGLPSATGTLKFGIGTQSDNGLGSAVVQTLNRYGNFTTVFNGVSYSSSFIDSGTNGLFFLDSATTGLPECTLSVGFYCPPTLQSLSATNVGTNNQPKVVNFSVINADNLPAANYIFDDVAGTSSFGGSGTGLPTMYFDWGLPFFFGKTVFVAIEGKTTPGGTGPYWAY